MITCVFIWIPSEHTSAIPYRKGDKYDHGSDILALDLLRIASHLKHLRYSLEVEGMILSVAEVQGNLADCIVHFFVFFSPFPQPAVLLLRHRCAVLRGLLG